MMNIIIVITDTKRKSLVFAMETLRVFSLSEMIDEIKNGVFERIYTVTGIAGTYIRSSPDKTSKNNIDTYSVAGPQLIAVAQGYANSTPAISHYLELYLESLSEGAPYIKPVDSFRIPLAVVKRVFQNHVTIINEAAREFGIDQYLLGAIIIDEIARLAPFEPLLEKLHTGIIGRNTTVGVAQVSIETANTLIKKGLYNPNPKDRELPFGGNLKNIDREYLYPYVVNPRHNIRFAAALIKYVMGILSKSIDIHSHPEIVATFYSKRLREDTELKPSKRGKQIANEFYEYAKKWIR